MVLADQTQSLEFRPPASTAVLACNLCAEDRAKTGWPWNQGALLSASVAGPATSRFTERHCEKVRGEMEENTGTLSLMAHAHARTHTHTTDRAHGTLFNSPMSQIYF